MSFDCYQPGQTPIPIGASSIIATFTFDARQIVTASPSTYRSYVTGNQILTQAEQLVIEKYAGHKRRSGHDAHSHPIETSEILHNLSGELGTRPVRQNILLLALLHDILEDTLTTQDEILSAFGKEMLGYISFLTRIPSTGNETLDEINFQSYVDGLDKAPSIVQIVKMADRLHNLSTLLITHDLQFIEKQLNEFTDVYEQRFVSWSRNMKSPYHLIAPKLLTHIDIKATEIREALQRTTGQLGNDLN